MSSAGELDIRVRRPSTPGKNTQVLFNDAGVDGANANLTFDKANNTLTVGGSIPALGTKVILGKAVTTTESFLPVVGQQSSDGVGNDLALGATSTSGRVRIFTGVSTNSAEFGTGSNQERVRIGNDGNVGIGTGTTGPNTKLQVIASNSAAFIGTTPFMPLMLLANDTSGIGNTGIDFGDNGIRKASIGVQANGSGSWMRFGTSNNYGSGITNQGLTINPDGNVWVTTTASFLSTATVSNGTIDLVTANPQLGWYATGQAADSKRWNMVGSSVFTLRTLSDDGSAANNIFSVTRGVGAAISDLSFGNALNNPTYTFLGTGKVTVPNIQGINANVVVFHCSNYAFASGV